MANTSIKYLKDENGQKFSPIVNIKGIYDDNGNSLLDLFYPIGSYYETSNRNFDPNESWGGTWIQDTRGYVTVGAYDEGNNRPGNDRLYITQGQTLGEDSVTVNFTHTHPQTHIFTAKYRYANGLKYQSGETSVDDTVATQSSAWDSGNSDPVAGPKLVLNNKTWDNIQPSIGVIRWHRTA